MKKRFSGKLHRSKATRSVVPADRRPGIEDILRRIEEQHSADIHAIRQLCDIGNLCVRPGVDRAERLRGILQTAIFLTRAHRGNIQLLDAGSGSLVVAAHEGFEKPFLEFFARVAPRTTPGCGACLASDKRLVVHDVKSEPLFAGKPILEVLLAAGVRALQSTRLLSSAGNCMGMISTHFAHPHEPDERELQRLDLLARLTADYLEREQVEESLRKSELRWHSLAESVPSLLWTDLPDGQCNWLSSQWSGYTGIPEKELLGLNWLERVVHPEDRERAVACRDAAHANRTEYDVDFRIRRHDGQYRWFKTRGVPVRDERGQVLYWAGADTDIENIKLAEVRERKLRQHALNASKFEAVFNQADIMAGVMDLDGYLREVNDLAVDSCGYTREQVLDKPLWEAPWFRGSPEVQARVRAATERARAGEIARETMPYWIADGSERIVNFAVCPIRDESGAVCLLNPTGVDITERKRAEASMALHAAVVENSDDAILTKDLNGVITSWNKGATRIFGYAPDEVIGKHISIIIPEDRRREDAAILDRIRRGEHVRHHETVRQRKDRAFVDISLTVSPLRDADGQL